MNLDPVGICGLGAYLPEKTVDAREVAREAGVLRERFERIGARDLHLAADGELPSDMAVEACRRALDDAGVGLSDVDLIMYCGSVKDHARWQAGAKVQSALGCDDCFVVDFYQSCNGQNVAMTTARSMIRFDPDIHVVLVCAAERWDSSLERPVLGDALVFGDGASAAVLRRGHGRLRLVASAFSCRGEHHDLFCIPEVGAGAPVTREVLERGGHWFQPCRPPERTREDNLELAGRLEEDARRLLGRATSDAGIDPGEIGLVVCANTNRRHLQRMLEALDLADRPLAAWIEETGFLGTADVYYNLARARAEGLPAPGTPVAVVTTGGGYATAVSLLLS